MTVLKVDFVVIFCLCEGGQERMREDNLGASAEGTSDDFHIVQRPKGHVQVDGKLQRGKGGRKGRVRRKGRMGRKEG